MYVCMYAGAPCARRTTSKELGRAVSRSGRSDKFLKGKTSLFLDWDFNLLRLTNSHSPAKFEWYYVLTFFKKLQNYKRADVDILTLKICCKILTTVHLILH